MLGKNNEEGIGVERYRDKVVRWYTKVRKLEGYTIVHRKTVTRMQEIGEMEPAANINTVKPLMLEIILWAGNPFTD